MRSLRCNLMLTCVFVEGLSYVNPLRLIKALNCDKNLSQRDVSCSFWQAFDMLLHHIWETMWPHLLTWQDLSLAQVRARPPGDDFCSLLWPWLHITWSRLMVNTGLRELVPAAGLFSKHVLSRGGPIVKGFLHIFCGGKRKGRWLHGLAASCKLKLLTNGYNLGVFHQHNEICYMSFTCYRKCIG